MNHYLDTRDVRDDEIEIDLMELLYALKKGLLLILTCTLLVGCLACAYTKFFMKPTYESTSSILVLSKDTVDTSMADIQLGNYLTKDYEVLITSRPVLETVIENLGLDMETSVLKKVIKVTTSSNNRILQITAEYGDPLLAKRIVDEVAEEGSAFIGEKMGTEPPILIEDGEIPVHRTGPSMKKNALIGLAAGFVLSAGVIVLLTLLNDTIKSEEDIERYLGMTTLASVPDRKDFINEKKKSASKKGKKKKAAKKVKK